jgi:hypothetical protein
MLAAASSACDSAKWALRTRAGFGLGLGLGLGFGLGFGLRLGFGFRLEMGLGFGLQLEWIVPIDRYLAILAAASSACDSAK